MRRRLRKNLTFYGANALLPALIPLAIYALNFCVSWLLSRVLNLTYGYSNLRLGSHTVHTRRSNLTSSGNRLVCGSSYSIRIMPSIKFLG